MEKRRINRHYSNSDKMGVIKLYQQGYGSTTISNDVQICRTVVKAWIRLYESYGVSGFDKRPNEHYSISFKEQVVRDVLDYYLSYPSVALKYHISQSTAYQWVQLVKQEGFWSLKVTKQGRPTTAMGRPKKKQPETDLEKLEEELRYLRAENAYLKKVRALVQERLLRESGKQSKLSKN
jgi:transposase